MKNSEKQLEQIQKARFFEKIENYENYIFGKKEKAAFRDADRKTSRKTILKTLENPENNYF